MLKRELVESRWERLWDFMNEENLDALYVAGKGHILGYGPIFYLCGYHMVLRYSGALIKVGNPPIFFVPTPAEQALVKERSFIKDVRCTSTPAQAALDEMKSVYGDSFKLGINDPEGYFTVSDYKVFESVRNDGQVVDATQLLNRVKAIKFEEEVAGMKRTFEIADNGFETFISCVKPGMTGRELVAEVDKKIRAQGAIERLLFIGAGSHFLHWPDDRPLQKGDLVTFFVELVGPEGYWVEKGGMFSIGEPAHAEKRIAEACIQSVNTAVSKMYPGCSSKELSQSIEEIGNRAGVSSGIWHGHGVGIDHDIPFLVPGDENILEENMFLAIHPNFVDEKNNLSVSMADTFHITKDGARTLSRFESKLYIV